MAYIPGDALFMLNLFFAPFISENFAYSVIETQFHKVKEGETVNWHVFNWTTHFALIQFFPHFLSDFLD